MAVYQYQVLFEGARRPITILSHIGTLKEQWQYMRKNDLHTTFDREEIIINYRYVISVVGPNHPFSSMTTNPLTKGD